MDNIELWQSGGGGLKQSVVSSHVHMYSLALANLNLNLVFSNTFLDLLLPNVCILSAVFLEFKSRSRKTVRKTEVRI